MYLFIYFKHKLTVPKVFVLFLKLKCSHLIYDLMNYTENNYIPGVLVNIYFEKCFDSVAWEFLQNTLNYFNFGPFICNWIKTFQCNDVSCESQAGILSNFLKLGPGCRQGDPISPYIFFIMCLNIVN